MGRLLLLMIVLGCAEPIGVGPKLSVLPAGTIIRTGKNVYRTQAKTAIMSMEVFSAIARGIEDLDRRRRFDLLEGAEF